MGIDAKRVTVAGMAIQHRRRHAEHGAQDGDLERGEDFGVPENRNAACQRCRARPSSPFVSLSPKRIVVFIRAYTLSPLSGPIMGL